MMTSIELTEIEITRARQHCRCIVMFLRPGVCCLHLPCPIFTSGSIKGRLPEETVEDDGPR